MTTAMHNHMRLHTRPAAYVSKARQTEAMSHGRPGSRSFSFTGEFPDMADQQPVEATGRRRNYVAGHQTGSYHAIRQDDTARMPAINKHGVHVLPAMVMLVALFVCLGSVFLVQLGEREKIQGNINRKQSRISQLAVLSAGIEQDIVGKSNDVNIRQKAVTMGLISSKGVDAQYLEAPADAVITMTDASVIQSLASIWGQ